MSNLLTKLNDLRHTAIHEAGHAVIGRALGLKCGGASIVRDGQFAGFADIEDPDESGILSGWRARGRYRKPNLPWRGFILAKMAGAEAEAVLLGLSKGGDADDRYRIEEMLDNADLTFDQWDRREPRMRATTRRLIRYHEAAIKSVAAALLIYEALSAENIDVAAFSD
ncbi:hypothetical protein [Bradyrhizobium sp. JYMT SZCCT0428]|uniref:hypothetical protein n=1 Tax=Bradyrhizobium sp. JYMT SZCCT0428 TaxID=2807673 RepID=UPI001BAD9D7E|nr:hypothetical protein [Bradyrhizobium sp. JYMT SZCCT0428]MBR1149336.1 hypothetical protein [Bradyrhizobium sp. JYMT SZCCT0428]